MRNDLRIALVYVSHPREVARVIEAAARASH
jgi:hypothetical protein